MLTMRQNDVVFVSCSVFTLPNSLVDAQSSLSYLHHTSLNDKVFVANGQCKAVWLPRLKGAHVGPSPAVEG